MTKARIIVAIDSFKGCLTSSEANRAAAEGIRTSMPDATVLQIPVSDGGEGWLEAFQSAIGGRLVDVQVRDPLMRPIVAHYLIEGDTAVIEMARASGLTLLTPEERNPMIATSYGTGQLVADAVRRDCKHLIVGLGGSATSDCGRGMLQAIDDSQVEIPADVHFTIATDVSNPLCGKNGAAYVFGGQKMPDNQEQSKVDEMLSELDARARQFAEDSASRMGYDRQNEPGAGAAGGLGYAFLQYMNAECRSGIDLLLDVVHFDDLLLDASLVVTGEGSADRQTLMGKLPYGILHRAKRHRVPVVLIAGRINDRQSLLAAGFSHVECINPPYLSLEDAMNPDTAKINIINTLLSLTRPLTSSSSVATRHNFTEHGLSAPCNTVNIKP